jgi:dihydrofolate reductase
MTEIVIIAAIAKNGIIGSKNDIPWRISDDFKRFKRLTLGHPCIMGDSTFESLPEKSRPLPGRENIVLTLNHDYRPAGTTVFHDFYEAIHYVRNQGINKAFITGGATIYRLAMSVADTLELTHIHRQFEGDVSFPSYDPNQWQLTSSEDKESFDAISGTPISVTYATYRRR